MVTKIERTDLSESTEKNKKGCLFIALIILVILLGVGIYFKDYISALGNLIGITNQKIDQTNEEKNLKYKYSGNNNIINILLLGSDNDTKFDPDNVLTQTVIIVSINPGTKKVNMISIPRDSWVPITGMKGGYGKIDQASGLGGLSLARETVEKDFGIHIDYYAWVGLKEFVKGIDTIGGIDIDVNHPILDQEYPDDITGTNPYGAIRLYIPSGAQHLTGQEALEYVRSRHGDLKGDFGRSARQQQILIKVKEKMDNTDIIPKIPELTNDLNGSVKTDLTVDKLIQLAPLALQIKSTDITRYILDPPDYGKNAVSDDGQDIVQLDFNKIDKLFNKVFN